MDGPRVVRGVGKGFGCDRWRGTNRPAANRPEFADGPLDRNRTDRGACRTARGARVLSRRRGNDLARGALHPPGAVRARTRRVVPPAARGRCPCERARGARSFPDPALLRTAAAAHPRRRGGGARFPQRLPPSRHSAGRRGERLPQALRLPLSRLDLRQPRRAGDRHAWRGRVSRHRQRRARPQAAGLRRGPWLDLDRRRHRRSARYRRFPRRAGRGPRLARRRRSEDRPRGHRGAGRRTGRSSSRAASSRTISASPTRTRSAPISRTACRATGRSAGTSGRSCRAPASTT